MTAVTESPAPTQSTASWFQTEENRWRCLIAELIGIIRRKRTRDMHKTWLNANREKYLVWRRRYWQRKASFIAQAIRSTPEYRAKARAHRHKHPRKPWAGRPEYDRVRNAQPQHKEWMREYRRQWREKNLAHEIAVAREYLITHREATNKQRATYLRNHPEIRRKCMHNRRARLRGDKGSYDIKSWKALCESWGNRCLCCGSTRKLTIDHVIPLARGGRNVLENLQLLCKSCNSRKGTKSTDYRPT